MTYEHDYQVGQAFKYKSPYVNHMLVIVKISSSSYVYDVIYSDGSKEQLIMFFNQFDSAIKEGNHYEILRRTKLSRKYYGI